jgi:hypothetical protein
LTDANEHQPTELVWTAATRQGLNSLAHYLPLRLLIPNSVRDDLISKIDIQQFSSELKISCETAIESILTIIDHHDLDHSLEILTDLMIALRCSAIFYEIRLLIQKKFIHIITGKRQERLTRLKLKYKLETAQVYQQLCPHSDEQVVLLRCNRSEYIV